MLAIIIDIKIIDIKTNLHYFEQVSVPQSELLSLIGAAKSLGVRGLAEEGVNLNSR